MVVSFRFRTRIVIHGLPKNFDFTTNKIRGIIECVERIMPVTFTKVSLPFGWLGNMSHYSVEYLGVSWGSTEALFQALRFNDEVIRDLIRQEKSPFSAKLVAKKYADKMSVEPMSNQDLDNMELCLRLKLEQHPDLKQELLSTGDEVIIEDVTKRGKAGRHLFWGMALNDNVWVGENSLGKLWMKLREELKNGDCGS